MAQSNTIRAIMLTILCLAPLLPAAQAQESAIRSVASLPFALAGAAAVWDGSHVLVFGGSTTTGYSDAILRYDPSANAWSTSAARLPASGPYLSAVWTGTEALVFGLGDRVVAYDSATDAVTTRSMEMDGRNRAGAAWTGRAAYLFGGTSATGAPLSSILRVDPAGNVTPVDAQLERATADTTTVWTGKAIAVYAGTDDPAGSGMAYTFDPTTLIVRSTDIFPRGRGFAAIYDGTHSYVFGGEQVGFDYYESPIRWMDLEGGKRLNDHPFGTGRAFIAAAWTGDTAYLVGGENAEGPVANVVRYKPSLIPGGAQPKAVATETPTSTTPAPSTVATPASDPRIPTGATWWDSPAWSIEGAAASCEARGSPNIASVVLRSFRGNIRGTDPVTKAPLEVQGTWDLVIAHVADARACSPSNVDITRAPGQIHSFVVGTNFSSPLTMVPSTLIIDPGASAPTISGTGRADACAPLGQSSIALAGFSGELVDPGRPASSRGVWDLVLARPASSQRCDVTHTFSGGSAEDPGLIVALSGSASSSSPAPPVTPSPTPRTPCFDLLSCPIGDVSSIRSRILGVRGQVVSAAGIAVAGAPLLLLGEKDGALDLLSITQTLEDGSFSIPTAAAAPAYAATVLGGHVVLADLAAQKAGVPADGLLSLQLPVTAAAASAAHSQLTPPEVQLLADAFNTAKPFGVPRASPTEPANIPIDGYAGIRGLAVRPSTPQEDARVVLVEMSDKGSPRIPDPPGAQRPRYFAMQLADFDGKEIPIDEVVIELEAPEGSEGKEVLLHHFLLAEQRWETIKPQKNEAAGTYTASIDSLSLFAVSTTQPSALAAIVTNVASSPLLIPILGGAAVVAIAAVALGRVRRARGSKPTQAQPAPLALRAPPLPEREAIVSDLSVTAKGTNILTDVSFSFAQGDILALLGPSGSGKSTLLKALLGETSFRGEASLFGIDPTRRSTEHKKLIGYVSQETELYPDMTLRENVEYFGKQFGLTGQDLKTRVGPLLATLGLAERADTRVGLLSGGQQRRASIAATLVYSPSLLILDEPTSGLDPVTRKSLWKFIRQASRELGVTVIVTTHFLDEADLADRVVILNKGRVVKTGTPQELVRSLPGGGKAVVIELQSTSPAIEARVREAVRPLETRGVVAGVDLTGYTARFFTPNAQAASRDLLDAFGHAEVPVKQVTTEDCGMDAVFTFYAGERWRDAET